MSTYSVFFNSGASHRPFYWKTHPGQILHIIYGSRTNFLGTERRKFTFQLLRRRLGRCTSSDKLFTLIFKQYFFEYVQCYKNFVLFKIFDHVTTFVINHPRIICVKWNVKYLVWTMIFVLKSVIFAILKCVLVKTYTWHQN